MQGVDALVMQLSILSPLLPHVFPDVKDMQVAVVVPKDGNIAICRDIQSRELSFLAADDHFEAAGGGVQTSHGAVVAAAVQLGSP